MLNTEDARKMRAQCEQIEQHITLHGERLSPSVDYNVADVNFLKDTKILRPGAYSYPMFPYLCIICFIDI